MPTPKVLVLDRGEELAAQLKGLTDQFRPAADIVSCTRMGAVAEVLDEEGPFDVLVAGPSLGTRSGLARLRVIREDQPGTSLVLAFSRRPDAHRHHPHRRHRPRPPPGRRQRAGRRRQPGGDPVAGARALKVPSDNVKLILNKAETDVGIEIDQVTRLFPQGFESVLPYAKEVSRSINLGMPVIRRRPRRRSAG